MVYETRYSRIWLEGKTADAGRDSIERLKKQIISNPQDEDEMERNEGIQERIEALSEGENPNSQKSILCVLQGRFYFSAFASVAAMSRNVATPQKSTMKLSEALKKVSKI
jgi:hypothetical protein